MVTTRMKAVAFALLTGLALFLPIGTVVGQYPNSGPYPNSSPDPFLPHTQSVIFLFHKKQMPSSQISTKTLRKMPASKLRT
jgi:hypothetical protein